MAFDALYTTNQIQKFKVLLPYLEPAMQKNIAVYIKYMELKYTMELFRKHPFYVHSAAKENDKPDLRKLIHELKSYSSEAEIRQLDQMESMFQTMEMYQEMSQTMSVMQEMFPDMGSGGNDAASDTSMMNMLMGMLSPEQKAMYEAFSNTQT